MADMKQKSWWNKYYPEYMGEHGRCKYDYLAALTMHSFFWASAIMFPLFMRDYVAAGIPELLWIFNGICHAYIDNQKANKQSINLVDDQFFHIIQIVFTFVVANMTTR
ncbi:MAG: hypothetical protein K2N48_00095 [Muribaculaceae bacterium]|nr:hypothetical protein [Muribaculaceae bacterium]